MRKTTIYLDEALYQRVQRISDASGQTQASIIREAVEVFTRGAAPLPGSIGMGRSGRGDLSERVDELLEDLGESS